MATKTKCPSCEAELSIPDDPVLAELKESVDKLVAENGKLREKLEAAGVKPPAPAAAPAASRAVGKAKRRGLVTLLDDEEEGGDDDEDED